MTEFQINDPTLESQWRALILFGKNSATYKFAFAKSLLELINSERTTISLKELADPFSKHITRHLKESDKQGNSNSSTFLNHCRNFNDGQLSKEELLSITEKLGFVNVIDAFQNVNGGQIPDIFYEKDFKNGKKNIIIKDSLLSLKESFHFQNLNPEVEARWKLVETAWNLQINPSMLEVKYDETASLFFLENNIMRRKNITSVRDALNGYQKGKCFYSFQDISITGKQENLCDVDHFLPHINKISHANEEVNINGVWNLVLADSSINRQKSARVPDIKFLHRLFARNEFYIGSKHPLAETIINQTGNTKEKRKRFLERQYNIAKQNSIVTWKPEIEFEGNF